jgi:hypothetical protein
LWLYSCYRLLNLMTTALFSLMLISSLQFHPVHVSFTSIDIDLDKKEVSLSLKLYTSDFSLLFYHLYEVQINPEVNQDFSNDQLDLISKYLDRSLVLATGKDTLQYEYVRKEQDDDFIWIYLKGRWPGNDHGPVVLTNLLLLDLFEDQNNLVIVAQGTKEQGYAFNYRIRQQLLDIKDK